MIIDLIVDNLNGKKYQLCREYLSSPEETSFVMVGKAGETNSVPASREESEWFKLEIKNAT